MTSADLASRIQAALGDELAAAIELRHRLHASPQVSGDEGPTAAAVVSALRWGEGTSVADTGRLLAPRGPGVVLRAELDGLPITEATGVEWSARGPVMHACGHDVHLAAAVAAARAIASCDPTTPVSVLLQPREEAPPSGARQVVESGALAGARAIVAAHVQPQLPPGTVGVTPGVVNASTDEFEITVHGRGGHAGYPHTVRDPVLALAAIIVALQQLASRRVDPVHGAVCTVGRIEGGTASNVVPDRSALLGTLRLLDPADREPALEALTQIAGSTAAAYGCAAQIEIRSGEPALINNVALATHTAAHLRARDVPVDTTWRSFGSDDFSHFGAVHPALMAFVGVDGGAGLHEGRFLPPDGAIGLVAQTLIAAYLAAT